MFHILYTSSDDALYFFKFHENIFNDCLIARRLVVHQTVITQYKAWSGQGLVLSVASSLRVQLVFFCSLFSMVLFDTLGSPGVTIFAVDNRSLINHISSVICLLIMKPSCRPGPSCSKRR